MESRSPTQQRKNNFSTQNPTLFLTVPIHALNDARLLSEFCRFACHPDIVGKVVASDVQVTNQTVCQYAVSKNSNRRYVFSSPSELSCIQFPDDEKIKSITNNTNILDATCLKQLIELLRIPLHIYLQDAVKSIPDFLSSTDEFDKQLEESDKQYDKKYRGIAFCSNASQCLSFLIKKDFPPEPIRLLLQLPQLRSQLHTENAQLLNKIADALGVAMIRYMKHYTHGPFGYNSTLPSKLEFMTSLINKGANLNIIKHGDYPRFQTPVSAAAYYYQTDILRLLVQNGADVNLPNETESPLMKASKCGHAEIVEILLAADKINVNTVDKRISEGFHEGEGHCPLVKAIRGYVGKYPATKNDTKNYTRVIELLANHPDTDINKPSQAGKTPLKETIYWGEVQLLKILLASKKLSKQEINEALVYAQEWYKNNSGPTHPSPCSRERKIQAKQMIHLLSEACTDENSAENMYRI